MEKKDKIEKTIPFKSNDLEELFNDHIASYGYKRNEIKAKKMMLMKLIGHP